MNKPNSTRPTGNNSALTYRALLTVLALFIFVASGMAQVRLGVRQKNLSKGIDFKELAADSVLRFPRDTLPLLPKDSGAVAIITGKQYVFTGYKWDTLAGGAGGAGGLDTTLANMLYVQKTDSTQLLIDRQSGLKYQGQTISNTRPYKVLNSALQLRTSSEIDSTNTIYRMNRDGMVLDYIYDGADNTSADDSVSVIVNSGKRYKLYFTDYVLANWFGVTPDDGTDDSKAAQKAWDFAVRNLKTPVVKFLGGIYNISYLVLYKPKAGQPGEYDFFSGTIEGTSAGAGSGIGATTTFLNTNKNSFTIGIELGRNVVIRNINGEGQVPYLSKYSDVVTWTDNEWTAGGTIRNNRFSPNAFIVTDPFFGNVSSADRYPGMSSWYTNTAGSGTSSVLIDGCEARRFICAVLLSPNGTSQNGDNIRWENGVQVNNRTFWATCQTQTRGNSVSNLYSYGNTQYLMNAKEYGQQQGTPPRFTDLNAAGGHKYLYNYDGGFGSISFTGGYAESIWSLGKSGDLPVDFTNFDISMHIPTPTDGAKAAPVLAEGVQVNFKGGSLQWFDNIYAQAFPFNVQSLNFDGTEISGGVPFITDPYRRDRVSMQGVYYKNAEGYANLYDKSYTSDVAIIAINNKQVLPGTKFKQQGMGVVFEANGTKFDRVLMETSNVRYVAAGNYGYFVSTNPSRWNTGDAVTTYEQDVEYGNDIYSSAASTLGFVTSKSGDTIRLSYTPAGLVDNTSYNLYLMRIPKFIGRTFGNITSGSNTITDVVFDGSMGTFQGGNFIKGFGIPIGARVVSTTSNTITLSMPATSNGTAVELYDAKIKATATNETVYGGSATALDYDNLWFKGDEWRNVNGGEPYGGYFTQGGKRNVFGATYSEIKPQNNTGLATTAGNNIFTGLNQMTGANFWMGSATTEYGATGLRVGRSVNNSGITSIQSFGQKEGNYGGLNVYGSESQNSGDLTINKLGGNVAIGTDPVNGVKLQVEGQLRAKNVFQVYSNDNQRRAFFGSDNGVGTYIGSYNNTLSQEDNLQLEGKPIKLIVGGVTQVLADPTGVTFGSDIKAPGGTMTAINFSANGGYIAMNSDTSQFSFYGNGNGTTAGKFYQRGKSEFIDTTRIAKLRGTLWAGSNTRVMTVTAAGDVTPSATPYKSPDYVPQSITSGSAGTVSITPGYVGTAVYFNPTLGALASYTLTLPGSVEDNTMIEVHFGGSSSAQGGTIVTALSVVAGGTADIVQSTTPTTAVYGDCLLYRFYNNHYYRIK